MKFPQPSADELLEIQGVGRFVAAMGKPVVLRIPHVSIQVSIEPSMDPKLCYQLATGIYEQDELLLTQKYVEHGQRVLDIGGCIGVTAAVCARSSGRPVTVVEPNPSLHDVIKNQVALNGGSAQVEGCCVAADGPMERRFFVHQQPWRSALFEYPNGGMAYTEIQVPVVSLNELLSKHTPDVALVDVEGAEVGLFKEALVHKPHCFIVEIHDFYIGKEAADEVIADVLAQGYSLAESRGWNRAFVRNG